MENNNRRGMPFPSTNDSKIVCKFFETPSGCKNLNCKFYHPGTNIMSNSNSSNSNNITHNDNSNGHSFRGRVFNSRGFNNRGESSDRGGNYGRNKDFNNNNKKDRVKKQNDLTDQEADRELETLFGKISFGTPLNRVSIRILSPVDFKYEKGDWKPFMKNDQSKINVLYKENEKAKPVTFYFKFSDPFSLKIKSLVAKLAESNLYLDTNNNNLNYAWFYSGHILNSYADPKGLFNESLAEGNMKMIKRSYNDEHENYKFYKVVNDRDFKCVYLHDDFQFINKTLNGKKKQNVSPSNRGEGERLCSICLENENNWILIPCGHKCVCGECATRITACPLCRTQIVSKNIVYE